MDALLIILYNLVPLYLLAGVGFVAGRLLRIEKESLAKLLIYVITPVVVFDGASARSLSGELIIIPVVFFCIASGLALFFYYVLTPVWKDSTRNFFAFASGAGNTGYFGLPIAITLFGEGALPIITACILGTVLFENTTGFFLAARSLHTARDSISRLIRLPSVYAFALGIIFAIFSLHPQQFVGSSFLTFRGAYSVLGMMMIGLALSNIKRGHIDALLISLLCSVRFILWPALVLFFVILDGALTHIFSPEARRVMLLLACVPVAANTISFATELRTQPEKAAVVVCITTALAALVIPIASLAIIRWVP